VIASNSHETKFAPRIEEGNPKNPFFLDRLIHYEKVCAERWTEEEKVCQAAYRMLSENLSGRIQLSQSSSFARPRQDGVWVREPGD
jgi:hypothetical protein